MYGRWSPTTMHCEIRACARRRSSSTDGATFFPPAVTMISFFRPVIRTNPSASISPRSPLWNQPPARASALARGLLTYPRITLIPRTSNSPSSATRTSTPGRGRPTVPIRRFFGVLTVAGAVVSVSPQPSRITSPVPR